MKRYSFVFGILALLLASCDNDVIESMPPYIFFTHEVDTYVMDLDDPDPADVTIKGSISAQEQFRSFIVNGEEIDPELYGEEKNYMFSIPVSLSGKRDAFDVTFTLTDRVNRTVSKDFHFVPSSPIETYDVTLGAQYNPYQGFFFSFTDQKIYSVVEMKQMQSPEGFCFGYSVNKKMPMLVSPTELINQTIISDYKGSRISSFCEIVAVNEVNFTKEVFDGISNNALMRNLSPVGYGTYPFIGISVGKSYLVKNEDDSKRAIVYVQSLDNGVNGQVQLIIKMEKQ
ncbi:MAG: hypothetical protein NC349_04585 [Paenibacillus sp.]|nr:hypothetical protein [Paenibacillus sp.]